MIIMEAGITEGEAVVEVGIGMIVTGTTGGNVVISIAAGAVA